jgi:hypothetical protein
MIIDIMRTSASRTEFLKITTESLVKHLKHTDYFRWLIHEDCMNEKASNECIEYIKNCGIYSIVRQDNPPLGQSGSLTWLLNEVSSKYVINWEDDYELFKDINITELVNLMDNNSGINQIAFQKRNIWEGKGDFKHKQVKIDGISLVVSSHWSFPPSIIRTSFLKNVWQDLGDPIHWKIRELMQGKEQRDAEWMEKNVGNYFLGEIGSGHYIHNLGSHNKQKGSLRLGSYQF